MSMENKDLPAFPIMDANGFPGHAEVILKSDKPIVAGLTKREYFAAMVMQGMMSKYTGFSEFDKNIPKVSVAMADALLQELSKTPNP